jgi:hypothetical protein
MIDAPFGSDEENPAGVNTHQSEILLKVRWALMGWTLSMSSLDFIRL